MVLTSKVNKLEIFGVKYQNIQAFSYGIGNN